MICRITSTAASKRRDGGIACLANPGCAWPFSLRLHAAWDRIAIEELALQDSYANDGRLLQMCRVRCCDVGGIALHCSADSSTEVGEAAYFLRLLVYLRHTARVRLAVALLCQDGRGNPCVAFRHHRRSLGAAGIRAPRRAAGDDAPESRPCNGSGGHGAASGDLTEYPPPCGKKLACRQVLRHRLAVCQRRRDRRGA